MKPGFSYVVEDIEIGGEWLELMPAEALKAAPTTRNIQNTGTALSTTNGKYLPIPTASEFYPQLACRVRYGYSDVATNEALFIDDETMKGKDLVLASLAYSRSVNPSHSCLLYTSPSPRD